MMTRPAGLPPRVGGYDKQLTRWANAGYQRVLMFGRWWPLEIGRVYHVVFNHESPKDSKIVDVT